MTSQHEPLSEAKGARKRQLDDLAESCPAANLWLGQLLTIELTDFSQLPEWSKVTTCKAMVR